MRINEILVESKLDEGPVGSLVKAAGRGVGKAVGGVAKGVGAVAGGIAGIGSAFKKGFSAGKSTVAGEPDPNASKSATPTPGSSTPSASTSTGQTAAPDQTQANLAKTGNPVGAPSDQTPAASTAPADTKAAPAAAAKPAAAPTASAKPAAAPAADPKADTAYAQAQKAIAGLAPEQKKEVVTMIQADPKVKASLAKPAVQKPAAAAAPQAVAKPKIKQPLQIKGAKQAAPQPQQQLAASKENLGNMVAEGFSIFRKH